MRVLPLALWHLGSDAELVADARLQSRVTHGHLRSQACCALYCLWARRVLEGSENPWSEAVAALRGLWADEPASLAVLEESIRPDDPPGGRGGGYVVDCLHSARRAVEAGPYEQVVKAAVAIGDDTDTTACVAGGIAGLRDGVAAIPERWRRALRGREWLDPLLGALARTRFGAVGALTHPGPSRNQAARTRHACARLRACMHEHRKRSLTPVARAMSRSRRRSEFGSIKASTSGFRP